MKSYETGKLRNVGLFSHGGTGKTSLAEAMLFDAKAINRLGRVEDGSTVTDYDPDEIKRRMSVSVGLAPLEWDGHKINVVDTPGYADFVGEVVEAVRVVDAAVILLDASAGVEVGTEQAWRYAQQSGLPRLLFVNRMDRENANFAQVVAQARLALAASVVPLQVPIGSQQAFRGVVDLVRRQALQYQDGKLTTGEVPAELAAEVERLREQLVEAVAENDDALIEKYLEGEELSDEEVERGLRSAVRAGKVFPILCGAATANKGVEPLLDAVVRYLPSPLDAGAVRGTDPLSGKEVTLPVSSDSPLAALVFKTAADPYVGKLTYFRVFAGTLHSDSRVWNSVKGREERIGQVFFLRGKTQDPATEVHAGDIAAVAKLQETGTGDTLCQQDRPIVLEGITFPRPAFSAAVAPKTKADLDKLSTSLGRIVEEDPTIQVSKDAQTGEMILSGMGESHIDITAERMQRKFGVSVDITTPQVPYRETIRSATKVENKFKRQTGGHGQYGHVFLELSPLPHGEGFKFEDQIVGGVVPKQYIPAVEKGVVEAMQEGILAGYPVVDLKVVLYDGSFHPVDSSEMAFKIAASQGFKKGAAQAGPTLLEPIMDISVTVPEQFLGDVMGDLNGKRARVMGMDPQGDGTTVVQAQGPLAELQRYATDLRSITQGRGTFHMEFSHYEEVPAHAAQQIIAARKEADAKNA